MIAYRFRVYFEEMDDVERLIEIKANQSFKELHAAILNSIGFEAKTPASFYLTGDHWRKGKRFISEKRDKTGGDSLMEDFKLNAVVNDPHQKFLYITDDIFDWELRVILRKISKAEPDTQYPILIKTVGISPKQNNQKVIGAPTNEFEAMVDELMQDDDPNELADDINEIVTDSDSDSNEGEADTDSTS